MNAPKIQATPEPFDWSNDPAIILTRRDAVAAYINSDGDICVIQQRYPDDDACIVIPQQDAEFFASRIAALAQGRAEQGESRS
jgi:hypothetical protein